MYTFFDKFFDGVDGFVSGVRGLLHSDQTTYFPIMSAHTSQTLALNDGSLMSVIRVDGYLGQYFPEQYVQLVDSWSTFFRSLAADRTASGITLYWTYEYNPDGMSGKHNLRERMAEAAKRRGIDISDVLEEEAHLYGQICATEAQYLVVITGAAAIQKANTKEAMMRRREALKRQPRGEDAIIMGLAIPDLQPIHEQHVTKIEHHLRHAGRGYAYQRLNVYDALIAMRKMYDPSTTSDSWKPRLTMAEAGLRATDGVPLSTQIKQLSSEKPLDLSMILPPRLSTQMIRDNIVELNNYLVVGDRTYAPLFVRELAANPQPLESLIKHCYQSSTPVRITYSMSPNGEQANYWNKLLASIFTAFSVSNRQINKATTAMKAYQEGSGSVYAYGLSVTTWADTEVQYDKRGDALYSVKKLQERARTLEAYLQAWGEQQVENFFGCSVEATFSASMGYLHPSAAPQAPQIECDIAMQLPLMRAARTWQPETAIWFRTSDGVLSPYQPFSDKQSCMLTLVMGGMGYGKSNLISEHIQFFATHPDADETPYIRGMDFGASSSGVIDMIREALPADRKHEVFFESFTNNGTMVKNMLDTRLGCRYPLKDHAQFLVSWLIVICNTLAEKAGAGNVASIMESVIERAYQMCDDRSHFYRAKPFMIGDADPVVQAALEKYEFESDSYVTNWEVVDFLIEKAIENGNNPELIFAARLAQREAVPMFADIIDACSQSKEQFRSMPHVDGHPLVDAVLQALLNANKAFPCFAGRTNIDISESRITVFDMSEAFGRGTTEYDDWLRSVFFTVVLRLQTEDLFINYDLSGAELKQRYEELGISKALLKWHLDYLVKQDQSIKVFWGDELHRVSKVSGAFSIIDSMAYEARKYRVGLLLGTQMPEYFPNNILNLATSYFVFGVSQSPQTADELKKIFSLTQDERNAILAITPPSGAKGAQVFCVHDTKGGNQRLMLHFQMGGIKRWAYATEAEERSLRRILYEKGRNTGWARRTLARNVPDVKAAIRDRVAKNPEMSQDDAIQSIANELLESSRWRDD